MNIEINNSKILVIDDEVDFCALFHDFISDELQLITESVGNVALEKLENPSFDLILTDLTLPVIDGLEIVKKSIRLFPERPVVVMSGHDDHHPRVQTALNEGAVALLKKPFRDWSTIAGFLQNIIDQKK